MLYTSNGGREEGIKVRRLPIIENGGAVGGCWLATTVEVPRQGET